MGKFARPLQGEILRESRSDQRRALRLSSSVSSSAVWAEVLIHDLSETGLMFETSANLAIGEIVAVELPLINQTEARVIWQKENSFGCEFLTPIPPTTITAALLQAPRNLPESEIETTVEELPIGIKPSLEDMTKWKMEFERTKGALGYRLVGFRQASDGMTIAMVTKTN